MAELKTRKNDTSVEDFLNAVPDEKKRQDSFSILELMRGVTGFEPVMWGDSIVGYGSYRYKYASGRMGEWPLVGFSPRKQNLNRNSRDLTRVRALLSPMYLRSLPKNPVGL